MVRVQHCTNTEQLFYFLLVILRIALKCHMIFPRENFRYNLPREKFFRAILFRIYLGTDIYRQKFFLAIQHSCLSSKIFSLQTLVNQDCSKKFPAIYLSLGILYTYVNRAQKSHDLY
jgi:hypothetical protein